MAAFPAEAAFFHAAERRRGCGGVNIIDAHYTKAQLFKNTHGAGDVTGEKVRCQTVNGVVGHLQHFFFRIKSY